MKYLIKYTFSFLNVPYKWGGNNALEGFDCSGFIQEVLASVGRDPRGDQTAQMLFESLRFSSSKEEKAKPGAILFFGESRTQIHHTAFAIDEHRMIEAGGGDRGVRTIGDAEIRGAMVRIRPIQTRHDLIEILYPNYPKWIQQKENTKWEKK